MADTIGVGTPLKVQRALEATLKHYGIDDVSGHYHDTYGQALGNTLASLEMGVWQFDTSSAGLGGCPYAKGATGNVATEDVVYMLHGMGIETGIDLDRLIDAGVYISEALGREPNLARRRRRSAAKRGSALKHVRRSRLNFALPEGVQRVARVLQDAGHPHAPRMLDDAARTAQQAADALGIARRPDRQEHHLPPQERRCGGAGRDLGRPARGREEGRRAGRQDRPRRRRVREGQTGFSIGGVSPFAHATPPVTLIDRELFRFDEIWAAAGHPHAVVQLRPRELERLTGAPVADVAASTMNARAPSRCPRPASRSAG